MPLGSLQAGLLAQIGGVPATLAVGAMICAAAAIVTLAIIRRRERSLRQH